MRWLTRLLLDAVNENVDALPRRLHDLGGVRFNKEQEDELRVELREVYYRYSARRWARSTRCRCMRETRTNASRITCSGSIWPIDAP